jgi:hypothetical protein
MRAAVLMRALVAANRGVRDSIDGDAAWLQRMPIFRAVIQRRV